MDRDTRSLTSLLPMPRPRVVAWDYLRDAAGPIMPYGATVNISELRVDYPNGSRVRLFGADNYDTLRGLSLSGAVLDEFADFDPRAWPEVIRPALSDRQGNAAFIGTPKGHNAFYEIAQRARKNEDGNWYFLEIKASDAVPLNDSLPDAHERNLVTSEELGLARKEMSEDQYNQEYECSFEAAIKGSYYGKIINDFPKERIGKIPYDPAVQVWTSWDLGIRDSTAIWFAQVVGKEIRLIDYYENSGTDLGHYTTLLQRKPYTYAGHIVPHDAQAKELGTGKSRLEVLESLGLRTARVAPMHRVEDGINAVRVMLPRCWFDNGNCERGIEALRLYHAEYDDKLKALRAHPVHDWTSHAADSFRYLAMTLDSVKKSDFYRKLEYTHKGWF